MHAMKQFDDDMSGYLDREEFYRLMKYLSGNLKKGKHDYSSKDQLGRKKDKKSGKHKEKKSKEGKEGKDKKDKKSKY